MKKYINTASLLLATSLFASAEADVLRITFRDGSSQTLNVSDINEMTFEEVADAPFASKYTGTWEGVVSFSVGGMFTYNADIAVKIAADDATQTISVSYPEYCLSGTMMGDMTLGEVAITGLEWDDAKGGFYRNYGGQGVIQHIKAEQDGTVKMDSDCQLNDPSSILVTLGEDGTIKIDNPFKPGAMPLPMTATFEGLK